VTSKESKRCEVCGEPEPVSDRKWEDKLPANTREWIHVCRSGTAQSFADRWLHRPEACRDVLRGQLAELHAMAGRHNPTSSTPEQKAEFRRRHAETIARIGWEQAWENVRRALDHRERMGAEERARIESLWDAWDDARDPHEKAKLQMQLGETVASWMSHAEALEREIEAEQKPAGR